MIEFTKEDVIRLGSLLEGAYEQHFGDGNELEAWARSTARRDPPELALKKFVGIAFPNKTSQIDAYRLIFEVPLEDIPIYMEEGALSAIANWRLMLGR